MRKRKIISSILAISCLLGVSGRNGFAADLNNTNTEGSTKIRKIVKPNYTVIIPDQIDVPDSTTETGKLVEIRLSESFSIERNKKVQVKVKNYGSNASVVSSIKLSNNADSRDNLYSPVRVSEQKDGGKVYDLFQDENKSINGFSAIPPVAEFTCEGKDLAKKKLYVFRAFEVENSKEKRSKVALNPIAGTYTGKISFELSYVSM